MAENRRGKENRFYFSRGQMVLMGGAFILASAVIFALGMFVGKGIEERKIAKKAAPLVRIPVKPETMGAGAAAAQRRDEITFNDSASNASPPPAVPEPSKTEKPPEKIAKLEAPQPKAEKKTEKSAAPASAKKTQSLPSGASDDRGEVWRAQVNAYPDDRSARLLVDRLKNKGYKAYVSEVQSRGRTWYRVSVGPFGSRAEAEKVVEALKAKENHLNAFAASK